MDAGSNERRATYDGSRPLSETERSSRRRGRNVGSRPSKAVVFISPPKKKISTGCGESSIIDAESTPRTSTAIGSDQDSPIYTGSIRRRSTTTGPDSSTSTVTRSTPRRSTVAKNKTSTAVGTDSADGSAQRRSTSTRPEGKMSIGVGTTDESTPMRSTDMSSDPSWSTFVQYLDTSSTANLSWGLADGSPESAPSLRRSTKAKASPRRETDDLSSPRRATNVRPSGTTEGITRLNVATGAIPSSRTATYPGSSPSRETNTVSSTRRATYPSHSPSRTTETIPHSSLATPSRTPDAMPSTRAVTDSKCTQTSIIGLRSPTSRTSVTGFSPSESPAITPESTPRRPSAAIPRNKIGCKCPTRSIIGDGTHPSMATADEGSPVQSDVTEEESVERKNEWALNDLSVYQLTVKSLVVAVIACVQFSSGSNGEGGIYCSNNEGCMWNDKPEGTIGVDFQLDLRHVLLSVLFSVSMFLGLSRVPGERSWLCLIPWLLMVIFSLQKFHIIAVLNLLAFLTTCSHISAIFLMFLCLVLFYMEINIFYEVFLCTWYLHEDPTLK